MIFKRNESSLHYIRTFCIFLYFTVFYFLEFIVFNLHFIGLNFFCINLIVSHSECPSKRKMDYKSNK